MSYVLDGVTYYTVRFLNYDEDDLLGTVDVPEGGDATPYAPEPEEFEDMVFIGWSSDITNITYDKTVRPRYHSLYKVTFMNYAGTEALSVQTVEETYDAVPPEPEVISGMTFVEWDADYTNVQSDLTIHPVYEVSGFTVRFLNYAGDDLLSEQYVDKGGDAVPPAPEKITGMIFIGWSAPFREIDSDRTIRPRYRAVPPNPALNFYAANADGSSGDLLKTYKAVNACSTLDHTAGSFRIPGSFLHYDLTRLGWEGADASVTIPVTADLEQAAYLQLDLAQDSGDARNRRQDQSLTVTLRDAAGKEASVQASVGTPTLTWQEGTVESIPVSGREDLLQYSTFTPLGTLRLDTAAFSGVDLGEITQVKLTFDQPSGSIMLREIQSVN